MLVADVLHNTFTSLRIPRNAFNDDGEGGKKILKRAGRALQDLIEAFATVTFPASERLVRKMQCGVLSFLLIL